MYIFCIVGGGESWTLGDFGGGGGRVQSLQCPSEYFGEREREGMGT